MVKKAAPKTRPIPAKAAPKVVKAKPAAMTYAKWVDDPDRVMTHIEKYDLEDLIEKGDGICKISNFLPSYVAEGALKAVESIPAKEWNSTEALEDQDYNNISHKFWSTK